MADLFVFRMGNASETKADPTLPELLCKVDRLFKGPVDMNKAAYNLLLKHKKEVSCHHNKFVCISITLRIFGHK
jgi:hypothetical protein